VTLTSERRQGPFDEANVFRFWDLESGQLRARIGLPFPDVHKFELTPDGQTIVTDGPNGLIRILDVPTGNEISSTHLEPGVRGGGGLALSPDGKMLAASVRERLYLWERLG